MVTLFYYKSIDITKKKLTYSIAKLSLQKNYKINTSGPTKETHQGLQKSLANKRSYHTLKKCVICQKKQCLPWHFCKIYRKRFIHRERYFFQLYILLQF